MMRLETQLSKVESVSLGISRAMALLYMTNKFLALIAAMTSGL